MRSFTANSSLGSVNEILDHLFRDWNKYRCIVNCSSVEPPMVGHLDFTIPLLLEASSVCFVCLQRSSLLLQIQVSLQSESSLRFSKCVCPGRYTIITILVKKIHREERPNSQICRRKFPTLRIFPCRFFQDCCSVSL